jgi:outer membrane protein OmpU
VEAEVTTMKASFAFGPVTAAMSINDYDITGASNEEQSSYKVSYTVSDELSVSYGSETHETTGQTVLMKSSTKFLYHTLLVV